jgi:hypothetical protein
MNSIAMPTRLDSPMTSYKFCLGQKVEVIPLRPDRWPPIGEYVVTEQFSRDGEVYYCVKSPQEPYDRVVTESQLRAPSVNR